MEIDEEFMKKFKEHIEEDMGHECDDDIQMAVSGAVTVIRALSATMNESLKKDGDFAAVQEANETASHLEEIDQKLLE